MALLKEEWPQESTLKRFYRRGFGSVGLVYSEDEFAPLRNWQSVIRQEEAENRSAAPLSPKKESSFSKIPAPEEAQKQLAEDRGLIKQSTEPSSKEREHSLKSLEKEIGDPSWPKAKKARSSRHLFR